jgi:hypothetical protein
MRVCRENTNVFPAERDCPTVTVPKCGRASLRWTSVCLPEVNLDSHHEITFEKDLFSSMQRLTKRPKQALDKLQKQCDIWSSSTFQTYKRHTWGTRMISNNTKTSLNTSAFPILSCMGCCAYFSSNFIMHNRDNKDLVMPTSCAETLFSLGCWHFHIGQRVARCMHIEFAHGDCVFSWLANPYRFKQRNPLWFVVLVLSLVDFMIEEQSWSFLVHLDLKCTEHSETESSRWRRVEKKARCFWRRGQGCSTTKDLDAPHSFHHLARLHVCSIQVVASSVWNNKGFGLVPLISK